MTTNDEIRDRHAHHPPTPEAVSKHERVREAGTDFALLLNLILPESREKSLALTAVQEATMWANAAIAIHVSGAAAEPAPEPAPEPVQSDGIAAPCGQCNESVILREKAVNGSLNPHWGPDDRYTCEAKR